MNNKELVQLDLSDFVKSAKKHIGTDWPITVARAFGAIAGHSRNSVRSMTGQKFNLHSEYILGGIRSYPETESQLSRAAHAMKKYGDMNAAVYLRGSRSPKNSLAFMADHEKGETRTPHGANESLAVPTKTLKKKSYRTSKGRVKFKYKPKQLLRQFKDTGTYNGTTTISHQRSKRNGRRPGNAFLIKGKSGHTFIARSYRLSTGGDNRNLEFLYIFVPRANIKKGWEFAKNVWSDVLNTYDAVLSHHINNMPNRK